MATNLERLITESMGPDCWAVYSTQEKINEAYAGDYALAYAYGPESAPREVHLRVAEAGARELGLDTNDYLETWEEVVEFIDVYQSLPDHLKEYEE
jgi:hypothetical protein